MYDHAGRRFGVEVSALLRKSLPFLGHLQNQLQVRRTEKEGAHPNALVDPADRLPRIAGVEQKLLRAAAAEQVVDHLAVQLDDGDLAFQGQDLEPAVPVD